MKEKASSNIQLVPINIHKFEFINKNHFHSISTTVQRDLKVFTRTPDFSVNAKSRPLSRTRLESLPSDIKSDSKSLINSRMLIQRLIKNRYSQNCPSCGLDVYYSSNVSGNFKRCLYCEYTNSKNVVWYSNLAKLNKTAMIKKICKSSKFKVELSNKENEKIKTKKVSRAEITSIESFNDASKSNSKSTSFIKSNSVPSSPEFKSELTVSSFKFTRCKSEYDLNLKGTKIEDDQDYQDYAPILKKWGL